MDTRIKETLYEFCFTPAIKWEKLANLAMKENWKYLNTESDFDYPILVNYIVFTFKKLYNLYKKDSTQNWLVFNGNSICINTGLLTKNYERIFMIIKEDQNKTPDQKPYITKGFYPESSAEVCKFDVLPKKAKFFDKVEDLIFNTDLRLVANFEHILENPENKARIPEGIRNNPNLITILNGEIDRVKKRIDSNYKVAVPQYYDNKLQFLLPLSLSDDPNKTDLVLAVDKISNTCYKGYTCLTLDMAYNNARQIAKPETNWLAR